MQWRLCREIPHTYCCVARPATERRAVGRKGDRENRLRVAGKRRAAARHGAHAKQCLRLVDNGQYVFGAARHALQHGGERRVDWHIVDVERERPLLVVVGRQQLVQQALELRC